MKYTDSNLKAYLDHRAALVDYVTSIVGCRARAEDLVQDAFLRFVPDGRRPTGSGVAYLYRIVRNLAIDFTRRSAMESRHQNEETVEWLKPREESSPEQTALQHDRLDRLAGVLDGLPRRQRLAIEMHRVGGYTLAEIAERLDVSTATAHRLVRDAMAHLAAALD
ncbi:sigma-70 family RNA polymerase sigma factor [Alloalcanivorax marinus]|uniref:sigma-70 family RNA polymerase sigma factor n=1 Tax=Alloalcanivorax marinus TaxID=1177169 RepID=UPI0021D292D3|nr:sigma-70 family RNA polymerase sigma factor [Alloalcanivorax marinus]MCU5787979.1 RNA polymerase sigma factor [Alloalcanivorax marinus]